jgi:hypothetical protein
MGRGGGEIEAGVSRVRGAESSKTDWRKLAERDPVECAHQALKHYEKEFEKAFKAATPRDRWEWHDWDYWWETYDKVRLAQPEPSGWGPILFPMATFDSFGRDPGDGPYDGLHYDGAGCYSLEVEQMIDAIEAIARGEEPQLPEQGPFPSYDPYVAIEDPLPGASRALG